LRRRRVRLDQLRRRRRAGVQMPRRVDAARSWSPAFVRPQGFWRPTRDLGLNLPHPAIDRRAGMPGPELQAVASG